jgi:hypothetical protein
MPGTINGFSLAYTAIGGIVLWSGITGTSLTTTFKGILAGKAPTADEESIDTSSSAAAATAANSASGTTSATAASAPAGSASYTGSALQALWTSNGGAQNTAAMAEAVAMAESGGSATVTSSNPDGGTNVGVFQLDTRGVGSGYTVAQLQNANTNTRITVMATNNGRNWSEWGDPVTAALPGHQYTPGAAVP